MSRTSPGVDDSSRLVLLDRRSAEVFAVGHAREGLDRNLEPVIAAREADDVHLVPDLEVARLPAVATPLGGAAAVDAAGDLVELAFGVVKLARDADRFVCEVKRL